MELTDGDVSALSVLLSAERLAKLTSLTGSTRTAIELHQQTLNLGSALMAVTATVEIALRNAVCENLSAYFGVPGWLVRPPQPFAWRDTEKGKVEQAYDSGRRAAYSKMTQAEKASLDDLAFAKGKPQHLSHLGRAKQRRGQIAISDGKVIAELTLYFWKRLYGPDYEQSLWRTTLKRTFPNKKVSRADVAMHLENIYQARNRLAHHEPVIRRRLDETVTSIRFVTQHLLSPTPMEPTPLSKLIEADLAAVMAKAQALHAQLDAFRAIPS